MKSISIWSKNNPLSARWMIAICHIGLVILAISFGMISYMDDFRISYKIIPWFVMIYFIAYFFYPIKGRWNGLFRYSYNRRVKHDFTLVLSYSLLLATGINQFAFSQMPQEVRHPHVRLVVQNLEHDIIHHNTTPSKQGMKEMIRTYKEKIKSELKEMKKAFKENNDKKKGLRILLILLTVLAAIFITWLISSLSCSLSCSGNEGLAIIVLFGGLSGVVVVSVIAIRGILGTSSTHVQT